MEVELAAVGRNVAELRAARGMRLADLAEATGYTTSYLSQIERGISIPSLTALATVAIALGVEMTTLLELPAGPKVRVSRAGEGTELRLPPEGQTFQLVGTHGRDGAYTAIIQDIPMTPAEHRHFGERFIAVLSGSLRVSVGGEAHVLNQDDTLHYGAHEKHEGLSTGDEPAQVLILTSPALF